MIFEIFSFEKSVGGVIFRRQNGKVLYLLLQYRSWQWDFPKGHMEKGENEKDTLSREIQEETGIVDLDINPKFRMSSTYFYIAKGNEKKERKESGKGIYIFKKAVYYLVETKTEDVKIDFENKDFAWLNFNEALERINNSGSKKIISAAHVLLSEL